MRTNGTPPKECPPSESALGNLPAVAMQAQMTIVHAGVTVLTTYLSHAPASGASPRSGPKYPVRLIRSAGTFGPYQDSQSARKRISMLSRRSEERRVGKEC